MIMESLNQVRDHGGRKLPPGFRFQPTDEEIVFQYLSRKTFSHPLPPLLIPEFDVFGFDPWDLPGDPEQEKYFFCNKEASSRQNGGKTIKRGSASGFWKASGSDKRIICSKKMPIVGIRKTLVFHRISRKHCRAVRTHWIMHQYYITLSGNRSSQGSLIRIGDWTLCRVILKRRIRRTDVEDSDSYSSSASSSDSGVYTEVSSS